MQRPPVRQHPNQRHQVPRDGGAATLQTNAKAHHTKNKYAQSHRNSLRPDPLQNDRNSALRIQSNSTLVFCRNDRQAGEPARSRSTAPARHCKCGSPVTRSAGAIARNMAPATALNYPRTVPAPRRRQLHGSRLRCGLGHARRRARLLGFHFPLNVADGFTAALTALAGVARAGLLCRPAPAGNPVRPKSHVGILLEQTQSPRT